LNGAVRCPRFDACSAPVCPLDPQWPRAQHIQSERVCGLLTEVVKIGGRARVASVLTLEQFATLVREWPKVEARWTSIRARLRASATTGSRIDSARASFHHSPSGNQGLPLGSVSPDASVSHTERPSEPNALAGGAA
jgi:hypothetical protein